MKNIVIILLDEMRQDIAYGLRYPQLPLPHLAALRGEGVTCENAFVQYPTCIPSRASMLTGQYPCQIGIFNHGKTIPEEVATLPERLAACGYDAVAFGKTHHQDKGYRHFPEREGVEGYGTPNGGYDSAHGPIIGTFPGPMEEQHDMAACRQFREYLSTAQKPFIAHVGIMAPHPPLFPPREFDGVFPRDEIVMPMVSEAERASQGTMHRYLAERRWLCHPEPVRREIIGKYLDMAAYADHCVGFVIDSLRERGLLEETIVVLTADHGEMLGEHDLIGKWFTLYDDALRVPLIFRLPGAANRGLSLPQNIELVDLLPTLLDLAGIKRPESEAAALPGRSIAPLLEAPEAPHREAVFSMTENAFAIRTTRHKLILSAQRDCRGYAREFFSDSDNYLYDLEADPGETHNLFADPASVGIRAELSEMLLRHLIRYRSSLGATFPPSAG